ncbi:hypothetical protein G4228_003091 [Cervus hanglu yarkandensis]|nr:hypothetical protein G4228_003091 [Cervus hanglu yarkandensis]
MLCDLSLEINRLHLPVLFLQPTRHYEYKAFGVLEDFPADLPADLYMNLNYRRMGWIC